MSNIPGRFANPFKPGAGHMPPYLAGRVEETQEFFKLLGQSVVLQNLVIAGLRGIGKTVLLESFKPMAQEQGWLWAGTDYSESASVNEDMMALRLLTDVALITSGIKIGTSAKSRIGFMSQPIMSGTYLNFEFLTAFYNATPGLPSDKLKATLTFVWSCMQNSGVRGIIFAYDEAQTLNDHAAEKQYPLSVLLDVFQYLQKREIPFMLILTGLPTLLVRLVETRTYTERLFKVIIMRQLTPSESKDAIIKPIEESSHPLIFTNIGIKMIIEQSGGYPYFIQFLCREIYDILEQRQAKKEKFFIPLDALLQKLDNDFFAGRWARTTEREKELLNLIAEAGLAEFGIGQVAALSEVSNVKSFSKQQLSQMFGRLIDSGLLYRDRRGSYSFAVPLLERYIKRLNKSDASS